MPAGIPRQPDETTYQLVREGRFEEFNRLRKAGGSCLLQACNLRGLDLREFDFANVDLSDCYFRQADLRGMDLRTARLEGASLHAARISGAYFPVELAPAEIEMSVRLGTRMRYR